MSFEPGTRKARFFIKGDKPRVEFALWLEERSDFITEVDYSHEETEFPVLPVAGDVIEWAGATYRVVSRSFSGNGGAWRTTLHVRHDSET